jgi:outer membrane protein OmpA-like peptidoglycan-associated protein
MRTRLLPTLSALVLGALVACPAAGQVPDRAADAEAAFSTGLESLFSGWPGLGRLRGPSRANLRAWAEADGMRVRLEANCAKARLADLELGALEVAVAWPPGADRAEVTLRIDGPAGRLEARGRMPVELDGSDGHLVWGPGVVELRVELREAHLARWTGAFPGLALAGQADIDVDVAGDASAPAVQLRLAGRDVLWRGERVGEVEAQWDLDGDVAAIAATVGAPDDPTATGTLRLPLRLDLGAGTATWLDAQPMELALRATGLTADRLRPLWSAPGGADFLLDVSVDGRGALDDLALTGDVTGEYRAAGGEVPVTVRLEAGPRTQSLRFALGDDLATVQLDTGIVLAQVRRQEEPPVKAAVTGEVGLALPLALAAPFLGFLHQPEGTLTGGVAVSGSLGVPRLDGTIDVVEARATLPALNRRVGDLAAQVVFSGDRIELTSLSASSGGGTLAGSGAVRLTATPPGHDGPLWSAWGLVGGAELVVASFPVVQAALPVARADGTLTAELIAEPDALRVDVAVTGGRLKLTGEKVPDATPIPSDPAVRTRMLPGEDEDAGGLLAGGGHLALTVDLIEPVPVEGNGIKLTVGGRLALDRAGPVVRVDGGFDVLPKGRFQLFDNRFEVRSGRLTLAEGRLDRPATGEGGADVLADPDRPPVVRPLDPVLDFVGRSKVVDTHVMVKLQGRAARPELVLASVPSLPPYQVLTLLIVGRVDVVDDRGGKVRREAAKLVDRFHNPGLKRQLFDSIGVDNLGLGFGSNVSQPIVTVGKQITRQLYVETVYHHNAPPGQNRMQGNVQYRLTPSWKLDTVFGDAGEGGIGAFWGTRFGGPPAPPPPGEDWGITPPRERGDADGDGLQDPFDLCIQEAEDFDEFQDDDGCPDPDNDGDRIPDERDAAPLEPETFNGFEDDDGAPDLAPPRLFDVTGRFGTVAFPVGRARLDEAGARVAQATAVVLTRLPGVRVRLVGHSDDQGGRSTNLAVSRSRAAAVRTLLVRAGVSARRITIEAAGEDRPLDSSGTPEARDRNRRVELLFEVAPEAGGVP